MDYASAVMEATRISTLAVALGGSFAVIVLVLVIFLLLHLSAKRKARRQREAQDRMDYEDEAHYGRYPGWRDVSDSHPEERSAWWEDYEIDAPSYRPGRPNPGPMAYVDDENPPF